MGSTEHAICKCSNKGRNLVIYIDGTSNQFGEQNTNIVELYSKIVKTEDSGQLIYYNSDIGTSVDPSCKSVKYLIQVIDNAVDLAIAWNFEKIVMGAYRWLSEYHQANDRIFLFGFSRGAYQVRALAGMIQKVGLIRKGNIEQIPAAYEVYATHTVASATCFKASFSRENVPVHFIGVWDTVSSVGIIRGKSLPLTNSADHHVCFFRQALALDERRVKFLPEYVRGGNTASERRGTGLKHVKEVWFPGTHADIGGGNQSNSNLNLGRTPLLWMSYEAVSCGLWLHPTQHIFKWVPIKRLSYEDESSTVYRFHKGRGRKIKSGRKVHSSVAFCDESYRSRAILTDGRCLDGLVKKRSPSNREWVEGREDLLEMDIFDFSSMPNVIEMLKSGTGNGISIWVYHLTTMVSTGKGLTALRSRPNIINDLVQIITRANQTVEVQECVTAILEMSSKDHASILLSLEHRLWLLRVAREKSEINHRSFAVKLLAHSLTGEHSCEDIIDQNALSILVEMARDEQERWLADGAFAMYATLLNQNKSPQALFATNTLSIVRKRFMAEDSSSQDVAKRLLGVILQNAENRQHLFDNDVLHSFLTKIEDLNDTERFLFGMFLVNQYEHLASEFFTLISKLCNRINDPQISHSRHNILLVLGVTIDCDGLRKRMWNSETCAALRQALNQVGSPVRSLVLQLYRKCIIYEGLRNDLFDTDTVRDLRHVLFDSRSDVRGDTIDFFTAAIAREGFRDSIFDIETVETTGLRRALKDRNEYVRSSAIDILTSAIAHEGFRERIFNIEIISALRHALSDEHLCIRRSAVQIFTSVIARCAPLLSKDIYAEVFAEAFRDQIFDGEIITALQEALCDEHEHGVRDSAVKILTFAIAYESFRDKISTPRLSLPFEMHYVMKMNMSEGVLSNFSLLS